MLKYLQMATNKIVLYPSAMRDGSFDEKIMINMLGEVNPLTPEIVVTILEANGYRFYEDEAAEVLVLYVSHENSRKSFMRVPNTTAILKVKDIHRPRRQEEYSTLVLPLKNVEPQHLLVILKELFGSSRTHKFIVYRGSTNAIIIKSKNRTLKYIQELVQTLEALAPEGSQPKAAKKQKESL